MRLIYIHGKKLADAISVAATELQQGAVIAYPTETFYGIGVKFDLEYALEKLYKIKRRPQEKALPLIIGTSETLGLLTDFISEPALHLMNTFWPGPLTILFKAKKNISGYLTAGTGKIAVRVPGESFALQLARKIPFPITATSANPSGLPPASDAETVIQYFGDQLDLIIDGGKTPGGMPSTLVDSTGDMVKIVREGVVTKESLTMGLEYS